MTNSDVLLRDVPGRFFVQDRWHQFLAEHDDMNDALNRLTNGPNTALVFATDGVDPFEMTRWLDREAEYFVDEFKSRLMRGELKAKGYANASPKLEAIRKEIASKLTFDFAEGIGKYESIRFFGIQISKGWTLPWKQNVWSGSKHAVVKTGMKTRAV